MSTPYFSPITESFGRYVDTYNRYQEARDYFIDNYQILIRLEKSIRDTLTTALSSIIDDASRDYDEASNLYPFWKNYPPEDRGRAPKGDQYPWIEVGEHAIGRKLGRALLEHFEVHDTGFPTGADERFVLSSRAIDYETRSLSSHVWLGADIKTAGPRDDADHTVMSHNQISGNGTWEHPSDGIRNRPMEAIGARKTHLFYPALPPLIILSDGTVAPTITTAIKPIYSMSERIDDEWTGQPLSRLDLAVIPNGLLLDESPGYLKKHPGLLFPGKDDKTKNPLKVRARADFKKLRAIDAWRVTTIWERQS